ncbi:MAG: Gfo/Idh/MocA family oxidoreductase [Longimicrobiales bacterium]|nr:Gfo/Idh/MocA family oxidoreductase [Longimicrobiales bacterium]
MNDNRPIGIGMIGGGAVAQLVHLPLLAERTDVEIRAFSDPDDVKCHALGKRFSIPRLVSDEELISDEEIDAVFVHTPNHLHAGLVRRALEADKHVLVESPLATSSGEARDLVALADARGLNLAVGVGHRFRPDVAALRGFVHEGRAGEIYSARVVWMNRSTLRRRNVWRSSGHTLAAGALADLGVRALDLLLWILGDPEISSVYAIRTSEGDTPEDAANLMMKTKEGAALTLEVSWALFASEDRHYARVLGLEGSGQIEPLELFHCVGGRPMEITPNQDDGRRKGNRFLHAHRREHDHFLRAVRGHGTRIRHPEQIRLLEVLEAAYTSAAEDRSVEV